MRVDSDGNCLESKEITEIQIDSEIWLEKDFPKGLSVNIGEESGWIYINEETARQLIKGLQLAIESRWFELPVKEVK